MQSVLQGTELPPRPDVLVNEPAQVPPPKKRRGWLIIAAAASTIALVVGIGGVVAATGSDDVTTTVQRPSNVQDIYDGLEPGGSSSEQVPVEPIVEPVGSTVETAIPVGDALEGSGWKVEVVGFDEDATSEIAAENMFNDHPKHGKYALVEFKVTRTGPGSGDPFYDLYPSVIIRHQSFEEAVYEVLPNDMNERGKIPPGVSATGTFAFDVPRAGTETAVVYLEIDGRGPSTVGFLQVP
jgi:hypothetical protein